MDLSLLRNWDPGQLVMAGLWKLMRYVARHHRPWCPDVRLRLTRGEEVTPPPGQAVPLSTPMISFSSNDAIPQPRSNQAQARKLIRPAPCACALPDEPEIPPEVPARPSTPLLSCDGESRGSTVAHLLAQDVEILQENEEMA